MPTQPCGNNVSVCALAGSNAIRAHGLLHWACRCRTCAALCIPPYEPSDLVRRTTEAEYIRLTAIQHSNAFLSPDKPAAGCQQVPTDVCK